MAAASLSIDELREQHEAARLRLELAEFTATEKVVARLQENEQGSWVDPRGYLYDDQEMWASLLGNGAFGDSRQASQRPVYQTEEDLAAIRGSARFICARHPAAIAAVESLTSYVIGQGFGYRVVTDDIEQLAKEPLVPVVQECLDKFLDDNDWQAITEGELFAQSREDGEAFVALYADDGRVSARIIEPEFVTAPNSGSDLSQYREIADVDVDCRFGVITLCRDVRTVYGYHVAWDSEKRDCQFYPARRMEHIKLNDRHQPRRGVSDFFPVYQHLERVDKILRNFGESIKLLSAIAFIRKHAPQTTQGQADALRTAGATRNFQQQYPNGTKNYSEKRYLPGTILDISSGSDYIAPPIGQGHGDTFIQVQQAILRMVGTRWNMPEYLISGDASNNNMASALVSESPFVKFCQRQQRYYSRKFSNIAWKAIRLYFEVGKFASLVPRTEEGWQELCNRIDLQVTPPIVESRDKEKETNRRKLLSDTGILSLSTWADEEGYDLDREKSLGAVKTEKPNTLGNETPKGIEAIKALQQATAEAVEASWVEYQGDTESDGVE